MLHPGLRKAVPVAYLMAVVGALLAGGCVRGPIFVPVNQRVAIDRALVEYPGGAVMKEVVRNLTGPADIEVDSAGTMIIAEGATADQDPHIFGFRKDGGYFNIYPTGQRLPFTIPSIPSPPFSGSFRIYGPIGGTAFVKGKRFVSQLYSGGN